MRGGWGLLDVVEGNVMSWKKEGFVMFTWLLSFVTKRCLWYISVYVI